MSKIMMSPQKLEEKLEKIIRLLYPKSWTMEDCVRTYFRNNLSGTINEEGLNDFVWKTEEYEQRCLILLSDTESLTAEYNEERAGKYPRVIRNLIAWLDVEETVKYINQFVRK